MGADRRPTGSHHDDRLETAIEAGVKRTFQWAVDWPGWCRSGKTELDAMERLIDAAERYNVVIARAGLEPLPVSTYDLYVIESVGGGGGTDFGVPSVITEPDRRPMSAAEAERQVGLLEASWAVLADVVAGAPAQLRKGPRGGGRDRDKVVEHVLEAEHAYAREIGLKLPAPDAADPGSIATLRATMADALRESSDGVADRGSPLDAAVCAPPDRLARAGSRLEDRGPVRTRLTAERPRG